MLVSFTETEPWKRAEMEGFSRLRFYEVPLDFMRKRVCKWQDTLVPSSEGKPGQEIAH